MLLWGGGKSRGRPGYNGRKALRSSMKLVLIKITSINMSSVDQKYQAKSCFFVTALCSLKTTKNQIFI